VRQIVHFDWTLISMSAWGEGRHGRRRALDGLRGVAALVVVVHHTLMVSPTLMAAYAGAPTGAVPRLLVDTPLRVLWAGDAAVAVFFVLSGYVLAVSAARASWLSYYPRRLVRLYLPVWGATVLALVALAAFPRSAHSGRSIWVDGQSVPVTTGSMLRTLSLWAPDNLVAPLWSLRWEVLFSLLLPLYIAIAQWVRRLPLGPTLAVLSGGIAAGAAFRMEAIQYLPLFLIGVLLADREVELTARLTGWDGGRRLLVCVGSLLLLSSHLYPLVAAGAGLAVLLALACREVTAVLTRRLPLWLGRISYSLYLVHIIVVLAAASVVPLTAPMLLMVTIPASLGLAVVFHRYVEEPSQRLARRSVARRPGGDRKNVGDSDLTVGPIAT
jgi:peptidoglycan/LPS O-acetylase OafA/YrhL